MSGELSLSSITLAGVTLPLAGVLADVTIRHGRAGVYDSAQPSTAQLTLLGVSHAFTHAFRLGETLVVNATDGSTVAPRFTGKLTDATLVGNQLTAMAVGRLRTLSGYQVGAGAYPEEAWSARVVRAFTDAGLLSSLVVQAAAFDPVLVARAADPTSLADYLDELAEMVEAAVVDLPDGTILVQAVAARSLAGSVALDPAEVVAEPEWLIQLPGANVVTVSYGDPAAPSSATVQDATSVAQYGPIAVSIATTFKLAADALTVANNRLARNAWGHWTIEGARLLVGRRLTVGSPLVVSTLPPASPYNPWQPILEGWTDHVVSDGDELEWSMDLALSDPLRSGLALSWAGLPSSVAWDEVPAALEWRDAITLGDFY